MVNASIARSCFFSSLRLASMIISVVCVVCLRLIGLEGKYMDDVCAGLERLGHAFV